MDTPVATKPVRINRLLPYWAVFQADARQTLRGWAYRMWVGMSALALFGYLLYLFGVHRETGVVQLGSEFMSQLIHYAMLTSMMFVVVLTGGCITSERGTLADSVLSRGISRRQYFVGKWHARLAVVLGTVLALGASALLGSYFLLHEDQTLLGSAAALGVVAALLAVVVSLGVAVSALSNNTLLAIAIVWVLLCGAAFAFWLAPEQFRAPTQAWKNLPEILKGYFSGRALLRLAGWSMAVSCLAAAVGLAGFSRRDV